MDRIFILYIILVQDIYPAPKSIYEELTKMKNKQENISQAGNILDKYHTKNILYRHLIKNFLNTLLGLMRNLRIESVLEVGCGEGEITNIIGKTFNGCKINASDISFDIIKKAKAQFPDYDFSIQSVYSLPYKDNQFDLVVACEVLEHLVDPDNALKEIQRVCKKNFIVSVPNEPIWRILNITRGKYLRSLGNTPGHIQHWSPKRFNKLISNYFNIKEAKCPLPWIIIQCEK